MAPTAPSPEDKKAALEGVLQTASFLRAGQLCSFLRFVCEMEIAGRASEITEYLIGVEALGRAAGYSTAEDSIVRRRAIDLRDKLDEVYATELAGAPVRIELPKGRYVPHFVAASASAPAEAAMATVPRPAEVPAAGGGRSVVGPFVLGFVAGAVVSAGLCLTLLGQRPATPSTSDPGTSYEGEAAGNIFAGSTTTGECAVCSGGRRVRNIGNSATNYLEINGVRVTADGTYTVRVDYLLQGSRSFFIRVNGGPAVELALVGDSWLTLSTGSVSLPLKAGDNTIRFSNEHAYAPDLDRIIVR
jgi:hypothetical protein